MQRATSILVWILIACLAAATLAGQFDRLDLGEAGWAFDLFAHFPRHLVVAAILAAAIAALCRKRVPSALAAAIAIFHAILVLTTSSYSPPSEAPNDAKLVRIVSSNVHGSPDALAALSRLADKYAADLVSVYEVPALSDAELENLFPAASVVAVRQSVDGRELSKKMLAVSRLVVTPAEVFSTGGRSNRAVLRYQLSGESIQIIAAHPVSPDSPAGMRDRNRMLSALALGVDQAAPFVIMGDFNASPWSRIYRQLPGMRAGDPRLESTFPAQSPALGIPIDHILFGGGLQLRDYRVGPDIGSDHLPLFATFALPPE